MIQPEGSILELCHVTNDMDRAVDHWTNVFGAGPFYVFDVPAMAGQTNRGQPSIIDLRIGFGFSGGLLIELLQQMNDAPSVFREILDERGAGYHHVLLRVPFDQGRTRLESQGYAIAFSGSLPGGERFALFDTRDGNGGFVELMDLTPASFGPMELIHKAHMEWDGKTELKRDFMSLF
jgi:hypothetical protein